MAAEDRAEDTGLQDADAVTRAVAGDADAFETLVRRYQRQAVGVAYRLVGDTHAAADIAQDAFLRAYRGLGSLEDRRRFKAWFLRIVSNLALNYRRSRRGGVPRSLDGTLEGGDGFRRANDGVRLTTAPPSDGADAERLSAAIEQALAELPEKQRLALVLFSVEGLPQKEVAQIMGCRVELVKWNVFQARKTLRKQLERFMD